MRAPSLRPSAGLLVLSSLALGGLVLPAHADPVRAAPRVTGPPPGTRVYRVPSEAMVPTIAVGQNVLVRLYADPARARPAIGTIVVVHPPRSAGYDGTGRADATCADRRSLREGRPCARGRGGRWRTERYLQRIVAGPGDTVAFRVGRVVRNGRPTDEPFVAPTCADDRAGEVPCLLPKPITLPRNRYFLAGDNRGESNDSRFWGPVPRAWMIGEVAQIGVPSPTPFR